MKVGRIFMICILGCLLLIVGCRMNNLNAQIDQDLVLTTAELEMPFDTGIINNQTYVSGLCYSSDNNLILTYWHKENDASPGRNVIYMDGFYELGDSNNDTEGCNSLFFKVEGERSIALTEAVPYKNGILYVDNLEKQDTLCWKLKYHNGVKIVTIDSGSCYNFYPILKLVNNTPILVYQDKDSHDTIIKKVSDNETIVIDTISKITHQYWPVVKTDGRQYVFVACRDNGEKGFYVGDENGIEKIIIIDSLPISFTVFANIITASFEDNNSIKTIQSIEISTEEKIQYKADRMYYRLCGVSNNLCLAADQLFNPFAISLKDGKAKGFSNPCQRDSSTVGEDDEEPFVVYYSLTSDNNVIIEVLDNKECYHYYSLEVFERS